MTVAALPSTKSYLENGATRAFAAPFRFRAAGDLIVERIAADGTLTTLVLDVDYSVTGGATDAGGTVTTTIAGAAGGTLRIRRRTARAQPMVYATGDRFPAKSHEDALDRDMLIEQEQDADVADLAARALLLSPGETAGSVGLPAARANRVLGFGPLGQFLTLTYQAMATAVAPYLAPLFKGDPGGNVQSTGPFSALPQQSIALGTTLVQTSGPTRGVAIEDPTLTAADVAAFPRTMARTANARYFRRDEAVVSLAEVGVNGSGGATGDWGAMQEALAYLQRFANNYGGIYRGTPRLKLAPYMRMDFLTSIKQTLIIEGDGCGLEGGRSSIVDCSKGQGIGFIVERADTLASATNVPVTTGADGTILRNFAIIGTGAAMSQNDAAGISFKARASASDLYIEGFRGAGIRIVANSGGTGDARGNANCFKLRDIKVNGCYDGVYISGGDANAGLLQGMNVNFNARCGIYDSSFLGNTHVGHHSSGNGAGAAGRIVTVSYNGKRYVPQIFRDDYWSNTAPGTLAADGLPAWVYYEDGGPIPGGLPTWTPGGLYIFGAAYATDNRNARSVFIGCYTEGTQAPPQITWPSIAVGGFFSQHGDGMWLNGEQGMFNADKFAAGGAALEGANNALLIAGDNVPNFRVRPSGSVVRFDFGTLDSYHPMDIHGPGSTNAFGPNTVEVRNRLGLPSGGALDGFASAAPTYDPKVPAVVFSKLATGPVGWRNPGGTTAWTAFGA